MTDRSEIKDEPRIFMRHARAAGYCANGSDRVAARFGVSFRDFLKNGYPVSQVKDTNNPLVKKVSRLAIEEWERNRGGANGKG